MKHCAPGPSTRRGSRAFRSRRIPFATPPRADGDQHGLAARSGCAALLLQSGRYTTPAAVEARLEASPVRVVDFKNGISFPRVDCSPDPNLAPVVSLGGPYGGAEGQAVALSGAGVLDADGDAVTVGWSVDSPLCTLSGAETASASVTCVDDGAAAQVIIGALRAGLG